MLNWAGVWQINIFILFFFFSEYRTAPQQAGHGAHQGLPYEAAPAPRHCSAPELASSYLDGYPGSPGNLQYDLQEFGQSRACLGEECRGPQRCGMRVEQVRCLSSLGGPGLVISPSTMDLGSTVISREAEEQQGERVENMG